MIPTKDDNPLGLHLKYAISRIDGKPIGPDQQLFVLRLDAGGDSAHVRASRKALMIYADEIETHHPQLAADLRARYAP